MSRNTITVIQNIISVTCSETRFPLTLKNQSQLASGCGWNVVLCWFLAAIFVRVEAAAAAAADAAATTPAHPFCVFWAFWHCFSGTSSKLADVLRLDTVRRSKTRSDDIVLSRGETSSRNAGEERFANGSEVRQQTTLKEMTYKIISRWTRRTSQSHLGRN